MPLEAEYNVGRLEKACAEFKRLAQYAHFSENEFRAVRGDGILWPKDLTDFDCCHFFECDWHYNNVRYLSVVPLIYGKYDYVTVAKIRALVPIDTLWLASLWTLWAFTKSRRLSRVSK
jgi:hypothetical protein